MRSGQVLVTGASGFVGKWTVVELLRAGFTVRASVRSEDKAEAVRQAVTHQLGEDILYRLSFVKLNLMHDPGWTRAMLRIDAVIHAAGVVLSGGPDNPQRVIGPAVEGSERVLRFATLAGVKRIILTSSVAAVGYGHGSVRGVQHFTADDFTDIDAVRRPAAAVTGATMAERGAWAYARQEGLALTTIHPGHILGKGLDSDVSPSLQLIGWLLDGSRPKVPDIGVSVVDVRDVAALLVAALHQPATIGQRYLAASDYVSFAHMGFILAAAFPDWPVGLEVLPDWRIRLQAAFGGPMRGFINDLGHEKHYDRSKAEALLAGPLISGREAIVAAARSLIQFGLVSSRTTVESPAGGN
ncbi:MAG: NAD-dependent epimerase/dehydratase family protein [Devosia sp.]